MELKDIYRWNSKDKSALQILKSQTEKHRR